VLCLHLNIRIFFGIGYPNSNPNTTYQFDEFSDFECHGNVNGVVDKGSGRGLEIVFLVGGIKEIFR